jgi:hypothetical protein
MIHGYVAAKIAVKKWHSKEKAEGEENHTHDNEEAENKEAGKSI